MAYVRRRNESNAVTLSAQLPGYTPGALLVCSR
jgi:hypothetical protein